MAIVRLRPEDLKRAIAGGTLSLQFQPQVHVPTGKLVGAEAFARWPHPSYGMIGPGEIIALIEQGALHVEFDRWVLTELCAQQVRWQEESFDHVVRSEKSFHEKLEYLRQNPVRKGLVGPSKVPLNRQRATFEKLPFNGSVCVTSTM